MHTQISCRKMWHLIRVSNVCKLFRHFSSRNVLSQPDIPKIEIIQLFQYILRGGGGIGGRVGEVGGWEREGVK